MGRSARTDKLRCYVCCKRDGLRYEIDRLKPWSKGITWHNVEVVGKTRTGDYVKLHCRTCGHRYSSNSSAAFRALHFWEKEQAKKGL